jgi:hypothetical protein
VKTTRPDGTVLRTPFPDYEVEDPPGTGTNNIRTTYRIAGQIVALKERAGTAAGTLYYAYTDHLGSVAALSSTGGAYTAGSLARYDPLRQPPHRAGDNGQPGHQQPGLYRTSPQQQRHLPHGECRADLHERQTRVLSRYHLPEIVRLRDGNPVSPDTISCRFLMIRRQTRGNCLQG